MTDRDNRHAAVAFPVAIGVLLVLGVGVLLFGGSLIPTLGITVVGAALFLPPIRTAVVAVIALGLATLLMLTQDLEHPGYRIGNVDCTIRMQRPKLRPHIDRMRRTLADVMGIGVDCVSVKATTTERLGFEGREEGVSVSAVALIYRE